MMVYSSAMHSLLVVLLGAFAVTWWRVGPRVHLTDIDKWMDSKPVGWLSDLVMTPPGRATAQMLQKKGSGGAHKTSELTKEPTLSPNKTEGDQSAEQLAHMKEGERTDGDITAAVPWKPSTGETDVERRLNERFEQTKGGVAPVDVEEIVEHEELNKNRAIAALAEREGRQQKGKPMRETEDEFCSHLLHLEQQSIKSEVVFALFALAKAQSPDATPAHQWSPATHMAKRTIAMQSVLEAHLVPATKALNATRKTAYLEMLGWTEADMRKRSEAEKDDVLVDATSEYCFQHSDPADDQGYMYQMCPKGMASSDNMRRSLWGDGGGSGGLSDNSHAGHSHGDDDEIQDFVWSGNKAMPCADEGSATPCRQEDTVVGAMWDQTEALDRFSTAQEVLCSVGCSECRASNSKTKSCGQKTTKDTGIRPKDRNNVRCVEEKTPPTTRRFIAVTSPEQLPVHVVIKRRSSNKESIQPLSGLWGHLAAITPFSQAVTTRTPASVQSVSGNSQTGGVEGDEDGGNVLDKGDKPTGDKEEAAGTLGGATIGDTPSAPPSEYDTTTTTTFTVYSAQQCPDCPADRMLKRLLYVLLGLGLSILAVCIYVAVTESSKKPEALKPAVAPTFAMFTRHSQYCREEIHKSEAAKEYYRYSTQRQLDQQHAEYLAELDERDRQIEYYKAMAAEWQRRCEMMEALHQDAPGAQPAVIDPPPPAQLPPPVNATQVEAAPSQMSPWGRPVWQPAFETSPAHCGAEFGYGRPVADNNTDTVPVYSAQQCPECPADRMLKRLLYVLLGLGLSILAGIVYVAVTESSKKPEAVKPAVAPTFAMFARHSQYCREEINKSEAAKEYYRYSTQRQLDQQHSQYLAELDKRDRQIQYYKAMAAEWKKRCEMMEALHQDAPAAAAPAPAIAQGEPHSQTGGEGLAGVYGEEGYNEHDGEVVVPEDGVADDGAQPAVIDLPPPAQLPPPVNATQVEAAPSQMSPWGRPVWQPAFETSPAHCGAEFGYGRPVADNNTDTVPGAFESVPESNMAHFDDSDAPAAAAFAPAIAQGEPAGVNEEEGYNGHDGEVVVPEDGVADDGAQPAVIDLPPAQLPPPLVVVERAIQTDGIILQTTMRQHVSERAWYMWEADHASSAVDNWAVAAAIEMEQSYFILYL
ncbi:unnamed protein product [Vitrella brassicaformis CCMP3155]|uniref:Transmembrane protein n=1 Tax=Vitrella brassicaformis (strain CCMP3155) TaxID=1169540 RepID=A0A0G4ENR2_VITBC|nr:unnamed protein product [Vitrella brassicaformis CCMP3155]|eukprot:CEL98602.1 unnamed protein product [Vitrella brassicaformis CCMP3155]